MVFPAASVLSEMILNLFFARHPSRRCKIIQRQRKKCPGWITANSWNFFSKYNKNDITLLMERPLVNPSRFASTASALRCHEAELIMIEVMGIRHMFVDSKEWQKALLPKGCSGEELKKASLDIGNRLFPQFDNIKHPDRDGILIAEYARRNHF